MSFVSIPVIQFQARVGSRPASQLCATMWKDVDNNHGYHKQAVGQCKYSTPTDDNL